MEHLSKNSETLLIADIGGTNANFGIITIKEGSYHLVKAYQFPSQEIADFTDFMQRFLERIAQEEHLTFLRMVIGVAGSVQEQQHSVKPTHLNFYIDKPALMRATGIAHVLLINDFIAVACGYNLVENNLVIHAYEAEKFGQKAFIGAGTGLGQASALWSKKARCYIPSASEGGHTEWVLYDGFDQELRAFIQEKNIQSAPVTWEQLLSGKGVSLIYEFLGLQETYSETAVSIEIAHSRFQPDFISRYADADERCKKVFRLYGNYYARFAKQVALQTLCYGGLYIAGGIAAKNKKIFLNTEFMHEFTQHAQHHKLLEKIPIFLIQDYQVSLYGGAQYSTLHSLELV